MPYSYEYKITITLPDMAAINTVLAQDDICGFAIDCWQTDYNNDTENYPLNFRLDDTAIGSGINLDKIAFSSGANPPVFISSGIYQGTQPIIVTPYGTEFECSITALTLTIIIRVTIPKWATTRLATAHKTLFKLGWSGKNDGYWATRSYVPQITIQGGNNPQIVSGIFNGIWDTSSTGIYLTYESSFELNDYGIPPPVAAKENFFYRIPLNCAGYCIRFINQKG